MKKRLTWLMAAVLLLLLTACGSPQAQNGKMTVVATLDFYGEVAQAVGGKHVRVVSVIDDPAIDPHDYEPTTAVAKEVAGAKLILANGLGYDSWMDRVVAGGDKTADYLKVGEQLLKKKDGANEHLWYDPTTMPKLANALAARFAKLDPTHASDYAANAKAYLKKLAPLTALVARLKTQLSGQAAAQSEPVFGYSLDALGIREVAGHFAKAIEDGTDPSPQDVEGLQRAFAQHRVAFFVINTQADNRVVDEATASAKKAGVPVLKVTETLPAGKTYISWMMSQYDALADLKLP
ncbi:metal ABC transporter solute-binding protein, Zn/Mn family [Lacticaseibacillus mingshuiensis]|uniref:metal ABC transporter solute-binding protein, Zn/Mn family n=1 Tax=Lacticaseibacillus mingshuiensis TaxID=2799574 RepID=UPI0019430F2B|nr:zinc ABC transporter substrate-binding protein [Lacticaseibacillus mingshuiensis]